MILSNGENDQVEFKYGTLVPDIIARCIAAFANTKGGKIIVGYNEHKKTFINSSWKDTNIIERSLLLLEDPPQINIYNIEYNDHLLLIVDIQRNKDNLTYFHGALYMRIEAEIHLMDKNSIGKAFANRSKDMVTELLSALEKMNVRNEELHDQFEAHNIWAVNDSKKGFRWAIAFCIIGAILGAILGTIISKFILI